MRSIPGWMTGALSVGAIVGAFYLGGRAGATSAPTAPSGAFDLATTDLTSTAPIAASTAPPEMAVECEPGQRAVVRQMTGAAASVSCVSEARPVGLRLQPADVRYAETAPAPTGIVRVADRDNRPYARPAVITEPVEVYRPRSRPVSYESRQVEAPKRSVKKSVAIIAGSTAAGAVMGGVVKGKKGAVVGGIVGGGAATVWDQVTRRQHDDGR